MNWSNRLPSDIDSTLLKHATRVRVEFYKCCGEFGAEFKVCGRIEAETDDDEVTEPADLQPLFELLQRFQKLNQEEAQ